MFVVVWSFGVRPGSEEAFRTAYGPRGVWYDLFSRWPGFVEIELIEVTRSRYLTLDRWNSSTSYENFMANADDSYRALDLELDELCDEETLIGRGTVIGAS